MYWCLPRGLSKFFFIAVSSMLSLLRSFDTVKGVELIDTGAEIEGSLFCFKLGKI